MRTRPNRATKTQRRFFLNRELVSRMITAGSRTAMYGSREDARITEDADDGTGSDDEPPLNSIDWLVGWQKSASTSEATPEYTFQSMEPERDDPAHEFEYTMTYRISTDLLEVTGEPQITEDRGEMLARMKDVILTINYRKAIPLTHFYPDEEPAKKEPKPNTPLLEAARIDQAVTGLDEFL